MSAYAIETKDSLSCLQSYHRSFAEYGPLSTPMSSTGRSILQQHQMPHHQPTAALTPSDAYRLQVQYQGMVQPNGGFPAVGSTAGYEAAMNNFFEENFRQQHQQHAHQYRSASLLGSGYEKLIASGTATTTSETTKRRSSATSCDVSDGVVAANRCAEDRPSSGAASVGSGPRNSTSIDGKQQQQEQSALNGGVQAQRHPLQHHQQHHQDALQGLIQSAKVKIEDQAAAAVTGAINGESGGKPSQQQQQQRGSSGSSPSKNVHQQHGRVSTGETNSKITKGT